METSAIRCHFLLVVCSESVAGIWRTNCLPAAYVTDWLWPWATYWKCTNEIWVIWDGQSHWRSSTHMTAQCRLSIQFCGAFLIPFLRYNELSVEVVNFSYTCMYSAPPLDERRENVSKIFGNRSRLSQLSCHVGWLMTLFHSSIRVHVHMPYVRTLKIT